MSAQRPSIQDGLLLPNPGSRFEQFLAQQIGKGRYGSVSEAVLFKVALSLCRCYTQVMENLYTSKKVSI
jgi:hypothetical protein